jgi:hypothetical protein
MAPSGLHLSTVFKNKSDASRATHPEGICSQCLLEAKLLSNIFVLFAVMLISPPPFFFRFDIISYINMTYKEAP